MHVVHLPIFNAITSCLDSVAAMRVQQRSAVVRESPASIELIMIWDIFAALGQQKSELADVSESRSIHRLTQQDISNWNLDAKNPRSTEKAFEDFLDAVGHSYTLLNSFGGTALIVTRHEGLGGEIENNPKQCYCRSIHHHPYPPPSVAHGSICDQDGAIIDCF